MDNIMKSPLNPSEILQRIIDEGGSCDWVSDEYGLGNFYYICNECPVSKLYRYISGSGYNGCIHSVATKTGHSNPTDTEYKQVAIQLLEDLEMENLLDHGDETENR